MAEEFQEKIKQLIAERVDMSDLTVAQQNKIVRKLLDSMLLKINIAVFDELDDAGKEKAVKFLQAKDQETFLNYLNTKIKNLPELVAKNITETIEEFKELYKKYENTRHP